MKPAKIKGIMWLKKIYSLYRWLGVVKIQGIMPITGFRNLDDTGLFYLLGFCFLHSFLSWSCLHNCGGMDISDDIFVIVTFFRNVSKLFVLAIPKFHQISP